MPSRFAKLISLLNETQRKVRKSYIYKFCLLIALYGAIINLIVAVLLGFTFGILQILAWGLVTYIVKEEIPRMIAKARPTK